MPQVKDIGFWAPNRPPLLLYCLDYDLHNLLQLFIDSGAPLTEKDSDGETVLHRAAWTGNLQVIRIRANLVVEEPGSVLGCGF